MTDHPIVYEPVQLIIQTVGSRDAGHPIEQAQQCAEGMRTALVRVNGIYAALPAEFSEAADLSRHAAQRRILDLYVIRHPQDGPETRSLHDDDLMPALRKQARYHRRISDRAVEAMPGMDLQNSHCT